MSKCSRSSPDCPSNEACVVDPGRQNGICLALCDLDDCNEGQFCTSVRTANSSIQQVCMPRDQILKSSTLVTDPSTIGVEEIVAIAFGVFFVFLLFMVVKTCCFKSHRKKKEEIQMSKHGYPAQQPARVITPNAHLPSCPPQMTSGCPACGVTFALVYPSRPPATPPPTYSGYPRQQTPV